MCRKHKDGSNFIILPSITYPGENYEEPSFVVCTRTSRLQEYLRRIIGVVGQEIYGSIVPPHKVRNLLMLLRVACLVVDAPLRVRVPGIGRVTLSKRRAGRTAVSQPTANNPKKENKLETGQIAAI